MPRKVYVVIEGIDQETQELVIAFASEDDAKAFCSQKLKDNFGSRRCFTYEEVELR